MNRKLTLAAIGSMFMMAGCLGGYEAPTPGSPGSMGSGGSNTGGGNNNTGGGGSTAGGGSDGGAPAPSTAKPKFDADVAPIIMAQCSAAACHGGTGTSPIKFAAGTDLY